MKKHSGGCACGKVRYHTIGQPVKTGLCHCRYCQLRTGTAFGVSVYFKKENFKIDQETFKNKLKKDDNICEKCKKKDDSAFYDLVRYGEKICCFCFRKNEETIIPA